MNMISIHFRAEVFKEIYHTAFKTTDFRKYGTFVNDGYNANGTDTVISLHGCFFNLLCPSLYL